MQKREGKGLGSSALAAEAPWDTRGCGQGKGDQQALWGRGMPRSCSGGQKGEDKSDKHPETQQQASPESTPSVPQGRGWRSGIHIFQDPQGGRGVKRLTLLAVSLSVHHHHRGEHHAAG